MEIICKYFIYFIIYSFIGWLLEVICKYFQYKRFINRGFLIGPICPIYGYGVLGILFLIGKNTNDYLAVFLKAILICSFLEYFTSYFMEKLFKARWWDYSKRKFNINGRICLETMLPFGILGCLVVYVLHPLIEKLVLLINSKLLIIIAIFLFIIYLVDNIISFNVMSKIKNQIINKKIDSTEAIRKRVIKWIESNSYLYNHIKNAYPHFIITDKITKKIKKVTKL